MASADVCRPISSPLDDPSPKAGRQTSQGKTRDFPPTHPPHIRQLGPDDIGLRVYAPSRPPANEIAKIAAEEQEVTDVVVESETWERLGMNPDNVPQIARNASERIEEVLALYQ